MLLPYIESSVVAVLELADLSALGFEDKLAPALGHLPFVAVEP